jgi:tetratricopeptide (TPR) repeat protein
MEKAEEIFNSLVSIDKLEELPAESALEQLGQLIDLSWNFKRTNGLNKALEWSEELMRRPLSQVQFATLHYFMANAWADLKNLTRITKNQVWDWQQLEIEKQVFHLRSAFQSRGFSGLIKDRKCQILTNLANILNTIGRFIEAKEYWDKALDINPSFAMAIGNRGYGLSYFAQMLYDQGHASVFLRQAYLDLHSSLKGSLTEDAKESFQKIRIWIESIVAPSYLKDDIDMDSFSLGDSDLEIRYRTWCLKNRLYLNPLNDLGPFPIAARDILSTPDIVVKLGEGPYYHGYFNQMKQEFVSARYLYFEGINAKEAHFSDRGVVLFNTFDYPCYSLAIEKLKAAFRISYSIFDKISYFLNHYLNLSIPEKYVSFRTFWYESKKKQKGLRKEFQHTQNLPFRGLFWLGKDLYEDRPGFREVMNPEAEGLWEIRNHLEHKYLKLHEGYWHGPLPHDSQASFGLVDTFAYSLARREFIQKTLKVLKMVREALIYLSLGIHCEEKIRAKKRKANDIIAPMPLGIWEDEWKR